MSEEVEWGWGMQLTLMVFPGKERSELLNMQRHRTPPLAMQDAVSIISTASCHQVSHLVEAFSPWVLTLERAEIDETGFEVAMEVKSLEYAK